VIDNLTTNGALLNPAIAERLVANGCREVIFSLNAVDAADYHRMMAVKPATFDQVCANVRHLAAVRGPAAAAAVAGGAGTPELEPAPRPLIVVQFLIDRENFQRIPEMYRLGAALGADRLTLAPVLEIPRERIDKDRLLTPADGRLIQPQLEQILTWDRDAQLLQLAFPYQEWNGVLRQARFKVAGSLGAPIGTADTFTEKNGQCFFGYYTATIRGNGDLYPCCMLMHPDYKPLGNAMAGSFGDHWHGKAFTRLRFEMRELLLRGGRMFYRPGRFQALGVQCVEAHRCGLKNMYFREDAAFYADLGRALDAKRAREVRWLGSPRQAARAAEVLAFRVYYGLRVRAAALGTRLRRFVTSS